MLGCTRIQLGIQTTNDSGSIFFVHIWLYSKRKKDILSPWNANIIFFSCFSLCGSFFLFSLPLILSPTALHPNLTPRQSSNSTIGVTTYQRVSAPFDTPVTLALRLHFTIQGWYFLIRLIIHLVVRHINTKVDGHLMPDLPSTTLEIDYQMIQDVFCGEDLQVGREREREREEREKEGERMCDGRDNF